MGVPIVFAIIGLMKFNPEIIVNGGTEPEAAEKDFEAYRLVEKMKQNRVELGAGRAGTVFTSPEQSICVKQITDSSPEFSLNNVREEMNFMSEAISAGVRVPRPMMAVRLKKEGDFIVMETIKGSSLRDILTGEAELPETYDHDRFWDRLTSLVGRLNNNNIYHRDLHDGNVMIERETGEPVIIDFGLAATAFGDEDPYLVEDWPVPGNKYLFKRDEDQVSVMRQRMFRYLQKNKSSV